MTIIVCDFRDIAGEHAVGTVTFHAPESRPSAKALSVVTSGRHIIDLTDGQAVSPDLDPGPVTVELRAEGVWEEWVINLPADGRHDFSSLIDYKANWTPAVVSRIESLVNAASRAATVAGRSASAAKQAETTIVGIVADAQGAIRAGIADDLQSIADAVEAAEGHAAVAGERAGAAKGHADRAEAASAVAGDAEKKAAGHASQAEGSATAASGAASRAATVLNSTERQAGAAKASADQAAASATAAGDSEQKAAGHADRAAELEAQSKTSADQAAASATAASGSEQKAAEHARAAGETVASGIPENIRAAAAEVEAAAVPPTPDTLVKRNAGGFIQARFPVSITDVAPKGYVDDKVAVKADISHKHVSRDITDASSSLKRELSPNRLLKGNERGGIDVIGTDMIVDKWGDGINVAAPIGPRHVTNREYVDKADTALRASIDVKADKQVVDELAEKVEQSQGTDTPAAGKVAKWTAAGTMKTGAPAAADDAATKSYVDEQGKKYVITGMLSTSATAGSVPRRSATGTVKTGVPVAYDDAVNKRYVDDLANKFVYKTVKGDKGGTLSIYAVGYMHTAYISSGSNGEVFTLPSEIKHNHGPMYQPLIDISSNPSPNALVTCTNKTFTIERVNGKAFGGFAWISI